MAKKTKISEQVAQRFLSHVEQGWQAFWFNNGPIVHNLAELQKALPRLKAKTFSHHVTKKNNDIANWVHFVIGDRELAGKIKKSKTKQGVAKVVRARVNVLTKAAKLKVKKKK